MRASTVALDPGKWRAGVAIFDASAELLWAEDAVAPRGAQLAWDPYRTARGILATVARTAGDVEGLSWVVEAPRSYPGRRGREEDLETLRAVSAAVRDLSSPSAWREVAPSAWKGTAPKRITHRRARAALGTAELLRWHGGPDAADAVVLGLVHLGRLRRGARRPR